MSQFEKDRNASEFFLTTEPIQKFKLSGHFCRFFKSLDPEPKKPKKTGSKRDLDPGRWARWWHSAYLRQLGFGEVHLIVLLLQQVLQILNLKTRRTWRFLKQKKETSSKFLKLEPETIVSKCPNRKETGVLNSLPILVETSPRKCRLLKKVIKSRYSI